SVYTRGFVGSNPTRATRFKREGMIIEPGECNLKDWIKEVGISGRMQCTLMAAFRGADSDDSPEVKRVIRWIRKQCIKLNNPRSHFMRDTEFIDIKAL